MTTRSSIEAGGERGRGGIGTNLRYRPMQSKQTDAPVWASDSENLRTVMGAAAASILTAYNGHCAEDRGVLYEVKRPDSRRDFDNLARLVRHARESGSIHAVSDAIRAYELATAPVSVEDCLIDLTLDEEKAEAALDEAQLLALHEPMPARFAQLYETAREAIRCAGRVMEYAAKKMHVSHGRTV